MRMDRRTFLRLAVGAVSAAGLLGSYALLVERYLVQFSRYRIPVPNLPRAFEGLRIAHITDLHYGFLVPYAFVKRLLAKVDTMCKDVIACTGDYVHEVDRIDQIDAVWPLLSTLDAPLGVYSVLGNHDHWASTGRSLHWLGESGQDLHHKVTRLERDGQRLWFAGAGDLWEDHLHLDDLLGQIPDEECRIVLAHNPDSADSPFEGRIDLMLAGHTHGGQVNIPFYGTPVLPVRNKDYSFGLKTSPKGHRVFISRGIGWAVYPVRFNCFPEIPILELVSD